MVKQTKDLHSSLQPLWFIFRVVGLVPYDHNAKKRNRFQLSSTSKNYSLFVCCLLPVYALAVYFVKTALVPLPPSLRTLIYYSEIVNQTMMHATYGSFLVTSLWYRDKVVDVLNSLVEIDKCLQERPSVLHGRTKTLIILPLLLVLTLMLGIVLPGDFASRSLQIGYKKASMLIFTYAIFFCVYFGNLQFVTLILVIKQRLGVINGEVKDIVKEFCITRRVVNPAVVKKDIYWLSLPVESNMAVAERQRSRLRGIASRLSSLRENHYRLFKVAVTVNDVNGLPLLLTLMSTLTNLVVNTHVCLRYLSIQESLHAAFSKLLWAIGDAILVFQLTLVCYKTKEEYNRTASLIQDVLYDGKRIDKALWKEFNSFLGQIANTRLRFSANGFCDVDFGLLCGMAGAVVTYLMVLFQIN